MSYSQLILRDSAEIVWPLDDIIESSSISKPINFFTNDVYTYSASINIDNTNLIKTPVVFGGGTALSFTASSVGLSIPAIGRFSELYDNKDSVISFWFQSNSLFHEEYPVFKKRGSDKTGLFIKDNYLILRYGTSASYSQVSADISDLNEPHHIVASKTKSGLYLIIDGRTYSGAADNIFLPEDNDYLENDYIDFYGPPNGSWVIDSIAMYPNALNEQTAKRHYVYGLGKNVSDDVFYSRGGSLYNFSTLATERLADINWDYPDEWQLNEFVDLYVDSVGIRSLNFPSPTLYSFDSLLDKSNDSITFNLSSSATKASYIEIDRLHNKIGGGEYPFFLKIKLDGPLPDQYLSQRLISYGKFPDNEIIKFDLFNDGGQYQVKVSTISSASTAFNITNTASSIYLGMKFTGFTSIYFAEEGGTIQTASFSYYDENGFGLDPLISYFPPTADMVIRIGSSLNYNQESFTSNVYGVEQFTGTVERFIITQPDFVASATYSYLNSYNKPRYEFNWYSEESRFKVKTYGYGNFNIHTINISEYIDDLTQIMGSSVIKIGYPDINSASQVFFYASLLDYNGNTIHEKTKLSQVNFLEFLNNTNISNMYIKFDFEIFADDVTYYPPRIKYFQMQTFKSTNDKTVLRDEAGQNYVIHPTSSSTVYLPEIRYTPTTFITDNSGVKLNQTVADFTENILPKPLDPRTIEGLKLWLDARFINGLGRVNPSDDERVLVWSDLSDNTNNAISSSATAPVFRTQSLNALRMNQLTGADTDDLSFIISSNSNIEASAEGVVSGTRGIKITPNGNSTDSYIDVSFNSASITTFANQSYTVVGSIKLTKPQTASALHQNARKIVIYNTDGVTETFAASSFAATNTRGTYSLSAVFTTSASTTGSRIRFYNGSYDTADPVYWDNLGVYPVTASTSQYSWVQPLTLNDHPIIKFDGKSMSMSSTASVNQPYSLYVVGRNFNDGVFVSYSSSGGLYSDNGFYYVDSGNPVQSASINNEFNVYSILVNSGSARLYINGSLLYKQYSGHKDISSLVIGSGGSPISYLSGDMSAILLYDGIHGYQERSAIENWLDESFNLIHNILPQTPLNDQYFNEYTQRYPIS